MAKERIFQVVEEALFFKTIAPGKRPQLLRTMENNILSRHRTKLDISTAYDNL